MENTSHPGMADTAALRSLKSKLINMAIMPYYTVRNLRPIWLNVLNGEARKKFLEHPVTLDAVQQRVVESLQKDGIATTSVEELFPGQDLLHTLQRFAEPMEALAILNKKKPFLLQLFDTFPKLDLENPFIRMSLDARVFDIVNGYFKLWSKFSYVSLMKTLPVPDGTKPQQSQRWHRDPAEKMLIKMFVYLNDVGPEAGPFFYVRGSNYGGKWRHAFPQRLPDGFYPTDGDVEKRIPETDIQMCTGRAGTIIFADTTGLHRGGYATGAERLMFTAGYDTAASPRGIFFQHPDGGLEGLKDTLSPQAWFALAGRKFGQGKGY